MYVFLYSFHGFTILGLLELGFWVFLNDVVLLFYSVPTRRACYMSDATHSTPEFGELPTPTHAELDALDSVNGSKSRRIVTNYREATKCQDRIKPDFCAQFAMFPKLGQVEKRAIAL